MKKAILSLMVLSVLVVSFGFVLAGKPTLFDNNEVKNGLTKTECTTIQEGLFASNGDPIVLGFDDYGYNYQVHQYIGLYGNYQRPSSPVDSGYKLVMKWNDALLANTDCDGDGKLDRHY